MTVLVTGVARDFPARCARHLAGRFDVVGIDITPPRRDLGRAHYLRADVRSPMLSSILRDIGPEVVIHHPRTDNPAVPPSLAVMHLVAALESVDTFNHLILSSSTTVHPAAATAPAVRTPDESDPVPLRGPARRLWETERWVLDSGCPATVVRMADPLSPDSPLGAHFSGQVVRVPMGFNPRLQFLHPSDATAAVAAAVAAGPSGALDLAAPDVLLLDQVLRILGRVGLPTLPALLGSLADELTHGRVVDPTPAQRVLGWRAHTTGRQVVQEYAGHVAPGWFSLEAAERQWARLRGRRA